MDGFLYEDLSTFQNFSSVDEELDSDFDFGGAEEAGGSSTTVTYSGGSKIKVFACRHTFHVGCLRSYYMKKFGGTPTGKEEIERMFKSAQEKLRCVTCNLKNIEVDSDKTGNKRAGVNTGRPMTVSGQ